jgi:hypothetical protein
MKTISCNWWAVVAASLIGCGSPSPRLLSGLSARAGGYNILSFGGAGLGNEVLRTRRSRRSALRRRSFRLVRSSATAPRTMLLLVATFHSRRGTA